MPPARLFDPPAEPVSPRQPAPIINRPSRRDTVRSTVRSAPVKLSLGALEDVDLGMFYRSNTEVNAANFYQKASLLW